MTEYSPLRQRLDDLFRFPTARVSVPVYDSNGTVLPQPETRQVTENARKASA
jgi:hypothetical protein